MIVIWCAEKTGAEALFAEFSGTPFVLGDNCVCADKGKPNFMKLVFSSRTINTIIPKPSKKQR